jgi:3-deoxy-D-manno-octulosonic-acid transferase
MLFFYSLGVWFYTLIILLVSPFNAKAREWIRGRRGILGKISTEAGSIGRTYWFHFASLGEFEQGRPVLEALKKQAPGKKVVVTFFSPSGYRVRKRYPVADHVFYLPLDTAKNAREFIRIINPELAVFTKYDYWYYYFRELSRQEIPLYVISAIFRKQQPFFRWYGGLHRAMLGFVDTIFVQDERSRKLLEEIGVFERTGAPGIDPLRGKVVVAGDTRFDRVAEVAGNARKFPEIEKFIGGAPVFVCGSTWEKDERLLTALPGRYPGWKFIIAPHETGESRIREIRSLFGEAETVLHSCMDKPARVLVIDTVGILSSLYQYGLIAYIGGGFGAGIHNTLEAAAFDLPVIFGPNYRRFKEACDLTGAGAAFSIRNEHELHAIADSLMNDGVRQLAGKAAGEYVRLHTGATGKIVSGISG